MKNSTEKPWYLPSLIAFLSEDVPAALDISPAALARDVKTLEQRVSHEGESFLTKTLPKLASQVDLALQERAPLAVPGFKTRTRRSSLPAFLQGLLKRVFKDDGTLVETPCIQSIRLIRQLGYWCKKIEKGYSNESLRAASDNFIKIDASLPEVSASTDPQLLGRARAVVSLALKGIREGLRDLRPRHGPGSVADGEGPVGKRALRTSFQWLERVFRPIPFFRSLRDAAENPSSILDRPKRVVGFDRLEFVNKDSKGPRSINLPPAEYIWCQEALMRLMYTHLEEESFLKGQINFTDQTINQELTKLWMEIDTLDLKDASDRCSLSLARFLLKGEAIWPYLEASRTHGTVLPDGRVLVYKKFAPMGSACCFPVEALVFYALAVSAISLAGYPFLLALKNVFVYGDDLIVPHGYSEVIDQAFTKVGLLLSQQKCCTAGKFRESCGADTYDGISVTPVRLRKPHASNRDPSTLVPVVEHANALYDAGYWRAAESFRECALQEFSTLRKLNLPWSTIDLPILHWRNPWRDTWTPVKPPKRMANNGRLWVRGYVVKPKCIRLPAALEVKMYRESLSLGGPVGRFIKKAKGKKERVLDKRFASTVTVKTVAVWQGGVREDVPDWCGESHANKQVRFGQSPPGKPGWSWPPAIVGKLI